jgi:hypothetical protein
MKDHIKILLKRYGELMDYINGSCPNSPAFKKGQIQELKYLINQLVRILNEPDLDLHHALLYNVLYGEEQRMYYFQAPTTSDSTPPEQYDGQIEIGKRIIQDLKEALATSRKCVISKKREIGTDKRKIIVYR